MIALSLIIPVFNEEASIGEVLEEAVEVLDGLRQPYEILIVNDGSTDETRKVLDSARSKFQGLRVFHGRPNCGQSAAFGVGFRKCRGQIAVLMDGDGQNDPHDIPVLIQALEANDACCGFRASRKDTFAKRAGSRIANAVRQRILQDGIRDTGCSLKAIKTEFVRDLPMALRGMHRFLPALLRMRGAKITQVPVHHRPRAGGKSKYTNLGRLRETVRDLRAVRWMQKRYRRYTVLEGDGQP